MQKNRFLFVDGLRGVAAMAVVLYHYRGAISDFAGDWLPAVIDALFGYGYLGIDIFFVISGFVIPYSIAKFEPSFRFLGRFGLRRSIRLDPPYWVTICLELVLIQGGLYFFSAQMSTDFPETKKILAHFVYGQDLLGYGNILSIFWTLCFEVQFYIFFVCSLIFAKNLTIKVGENPARILSSLVAAGLFIYSLLLFYTPLESPLAGLFIPRWFQFFTGYLAIRCIMSGRLTLEFSLACLLIVGFSVAFTGGADNGLTAVCIAVLLVFAGLKDKMHRWLAEDSIQFLGKISYSLYLIHLVIGWRVIKVLGIAVGENTSAVTYWTIFVLGVLSSIAAAWLMYLLIERPSLRICHEIKLDKAITWARLTAALNGWRGIR